MLKVNIQSVECQKPYMLYNVKQLTIVHLQRCPLTVSCNCSSDFYNELFVESSRSIVTANLYVAPQK